MAKKQSPGVAELADRLAGMGQPPEHSTLGSSEPEQALRRQRAGRARVYQQERLRAMFEELLERYQRIRETMILDQRTGAQQEFQELRVEVEEYRRRIFELLD